MTDISPYIPQVRRDGTMCAFYKDLQSKVEEGAFTGDQVAQLTHIGATLDRWLACDVDAPVINEITRGLGQVIRAVDEACSWAQDKVTAALKPHTCRGLIAKRLHNETTDAERTFAANASADFRKILDYVRNGRWSSQGIAINNDYMYDDQLAEMKRAYRYGRTRAILGRDMPAFRAEAHKTIGQALDGRPVSVDVDAVVTELFAQLGPERLAWQSAFDEIPPAQRLATIVGNEAKRLLGEVTVRAVHPGAQPAGYVVRRPRRPRSRGLTSPAGGLVPPRAERHVARGTHTGGRHDARRLARRPVCT
ncbi:hypothetical protein [Frankia sp. QA3]|uniref:hypothetical protein n=1 Tax=Frankia sp. QA3 TaxID=710111 RepID=UPI000269BEAB|nr:hypothetical protein [Frankia sp. QA3]EIV91467.1 hypothetical protein FraQA3DRAFT_0922 [Frankia sp. QA3]